MERPPAFQFYPKDFLTDPNVISMNMEERGVYITLLSYCWLQDGIPNDITFLRRLTSIRWKNARYLDFISKYFILRKSKWHHKRLDFERQKQENFRLQQRKNSLKRWKTKPSHGNAMAKRWESSPISNLQSADYRHLSEREIKKLITDKGGKYVGHESKGELIDLLYKLNKKYGKKS